MRELCFLIIKMSGNERIFHAHENTDIQELTQISIDNEIAMIT